MKLWLGKEKEGKYKGVYTLFVCGNEITFNEIHNTLNIHPAVKQIYFGAGRCSKFDIEIVKKCCKLFPYIMISVELRMDDLKLFSKKLLKKTNLYLMISVDDENKKLISLDPNNVQFKVQCLVNSSRIIAIDSFNNFTLVDTRRLKHNTYYGDKVIK